MIEGVEVGFSEHRQELVTEGGVHSLTLFVLVTVFLDLPEDFIIVEGGCPCQYGGRSNRVGRADDGDWSDKRILRRCQDELKVAILAPSAGTLDQRRVIDEETVGTLDG